jgi:hypothetical protein
MVITMKHLNYVMLWLAIIGLVVPQVGIASAADPVAKAGQVTIVDIALTQDNLLRGQVVNSEGTPKAKAKVTLASSGRVVAQTVTDDQGVFALQVARGGVYVLSDGEASAMVRAWTKAAAPPSTNSGILMVSDQNVTRGGMAGGLGNVIGWTAIALVVTGVIIAATDDDDDAS